MFSNALPYLALGATALCVAAFLIHALILHLRGQLGAHGRLMVRNVLVIGVLVALGGFVYMFASGHDFRYGMPRRLFRP